MSDELQKCLVSHLEIIRYKNIKQRWKYQKYEGMQAPVCPALLMPEARCVHQLVHHNSWIRQYSDHQVVTFIMIIINHFPLLTAEALQILENI